LYFGNGQIRYGEHGVDLSEFDSVDHVIRRAASSILLFFFSKDVGELHFIY
jgi:hypothetical protein